VTVLVYVALFAASGGGHIYRLALSGLVEFTQDTETTLASAEVYARWPLMVATLFWLAHRNRALYGRTAVALLLSGGTGIALFASLHTNLSQRDTHLVSDYFGLAGVGVSWYVLIALAVVLGVWSVRVRAAAALVAGPAVAHAILSTARPLPALPLEVRRIGAADARAGQPDAEVIALRPLQPRRPMPGPRQAGADAMPLRQTG
jgi:hypothetical protein